MNNFLLAPEKRKLRPVDLGKSFSKMNQSDTLTVEEQNFYDALCTADIQGYYSEVILYVFSNYSVEKFRMLIQELLQQRDDASYAIYKALGKKVYDCLLAIKRSAE